MSAQTDEFLNFLLWSAEKLNRPTFRNLTESYEGWSYRKGLLYIKRLETRQLIEPSPKAGADRLYRLTSQGRLRALGGRDPLAGWGRKWDGRWRLVLFDVPISENSHRRRLRRYLQQKGFGLLQGSVWITPHSIKEERELLSGGTVNVEALLFLDARPCAGESDAEIVNGAWDFEEINQRYTRHLQLLDDIPPAPRRTDSAFKEWKRRVAAEREAWLFAMEKDPLLPERILPAGYLGKRSWQARVDVLGKAAKQLVS